MAISLLGTFHLFPVRELVILSNLQPLLSVPTVKIVGRDRLDAFCHQHANGRRPAESWLAEAEDAIWKTPQDIKDRYASASFLAGNTVIFNIKGNSYRFVTTIAFGTGVVVVEWVGTHREYDAFSRNR